MFDQFIRNKEMRHRGGRETRDSHSYWVQDRGANPMGAGFVAERLGNNIPVQGRMAPVGAAERSQNVEAIGRRQDNIL